MSMEIRDIRCGGAGEGMAVPAGEALFSYKLYNDGGEFDRHDGGEYDRDGGGECRQTAVRLTVTRRGDAQPVWDSGWTDGARTWNLPYGGPPLEELTRYAVRIYSRVEGREEPLEAGAEFFTSLHEATGLPGDWIGYGPLLRTVFELDEAPAQAYIAAVGLGYFELYINGRRVGDQTLAPSYTFYSKRVEYLCYDVASYLRPGRNCVAMELCGHWPQSPDGSEQDNYQPGTYYQGPLRARAYLKMTSAGGRDTIVRTGETGWRCADGPVIRSGVYDGERYDARRERPGFSEPDYDDAGWHPAVRLEEDGAAFVCQSLPPIRRMREIAPVHVERLTDGDFLVDFGINLAGRCRLAVDAPEGAAVTLCHAEVRHENGGVNQANLRWAKACDTYLSAGRPAVYEPRFTYHGFRYVQVSGLPSLEAADIRAVEVRSSVADAGSFACSDERLNRLHGMMCLTISNNLHSIPTDCCQRDERQGWMGDGQLTNEAAIANFDMQMFYRKWMDDIADCQDADGNIPYVSAPAWAGGEALAWTCAYYEILYSLYRFYGDIPAVGKHYGGVARYFRYLETREDADGLLTLSGLCDWLAVEPTEEGNIRDALYFRFAAVMAELAGALGLADDEAAFRSKAESIRAAYNKRYYSPHPFTDRNSGYYGTCYYVGQAANAIPLSFGIPDAGDRPRIEEKLVYELTGSMGGLRLTTGFIGTKALFEALMLLGRDDLAYAFLRQDGYPSYGFMIEHGATTIWERWQHRTDNEMNSHCHPPLAAPDVWFYRAVAGLRGHAFGGDGRCVFRVEPALSLPLDHARAEQDTPFGRIAVEWRRENGAVSLMVRVPANAEALVRAGGGERLLRGGEHRITV